MTTQNTTLVRLLRIVAVLAIAQAATAVILSILTKILLGLSGEPDFAFLLGYNCFTLAVEYGIQIGMFAFLIAAAKHWQPTPAPVLLKAGGFTGAVGASLTLCLLLISTLYSYIGIMHRDNPWFTEEGFMKILMVIVGNPLSHTVLPQVAMIGLALCSAAFFTHPIKAVKIPAIALVAAVGVLLITAILPMDTRIDAIVSSILNFTVNGLCAAQWTALAVSYKQT